MSDLQFKIYIEKCIVTCPILIILSQLSKLTKLFKMQKNNISRAKHDFCEIIKILQCVLSFISIYIIHPKTSNFRENSSVNLPLFIRALQFLENDRKKGIKIFLYNGGNPYWGGCL